MIQHSGVHEKGQFNLLDLINNAKRNEEFVKAGAIAVFIGVVRGETFEGKKVVNLKMEAYEEKANEVLTTISKELSKKPWFMFLWLVHTGKKCFLCCEKL
jgi:molybdopterin synthase catalytic subunit